MLSNPIDELPGVRKALYVLQWVVNGVLTVTAAVFLVNGTDIEDWPKWYALAVAVGPVVWTYLGVTASSNVTGKAPDGTSLDAPPDPPA